MSQTRAIVTASAKGRGRDGGTTGRINAQGRRVAIGMVAPAMILMILVAVVPIGYAIWLSLNQYSRITPGLSRFVGFGNYLDALGSQEWWGAMGFTFAIAFIPTAEAPSHSCPSAAALRVRCLRVRSVARIAGVGLLASLAACGGDVPVATPSDDTRSPTVTFATAPPPSEAFAQDFAAQFPDLLDYVGVAVAGTGVTTPPFVAGDRAAHPALGTLTLPLGLAALERTNNAALNAVAQQAVSDPRSPAVAQLWAVLGGGQAAAFAVQRTLAKTSTAPVIVEETVPADTSAPVSGFGRTHWDVAEAAVFGAALPCRPGGATLLGTTGPALFESGLGSGSQTVVRDTAVVDGQTLLRQVAIAGLGDKRAGIAMTVRAPDEPAARAIVDRVDAWLVERLDVLPAGTCAGRGRARSTPTTSTPLAPSATSTTPATGATTR